MYSNQEAASRSEDYGWKCLKLVFPLLCNGSAICVDVSLTLDGMRMVSC